MELKDYIFVALDLETTGLDTKTDTIIEVAALRFHLEKDQAWKYRAIHEDERSMLINPGRKLEENISMITGISDNMLIGKKVWDEVQGKVHEFIGDAIIIGHNVLFDTAMLASHGINLGWNRVIDTFELSEIFSQDAESLNLGFLAEKYGFKWESEHRALDDVKLSIGLFCHYIEMLENIDDRSLWYWEYSRTHDISGMVDVLLLVTWREWGRVFDLSIFESFQDWNEVKNIKYEMYENTYLWEYISWDTTEYRKSLEETSKTNEKILILTEWGKDTKFQKNLTEAWWKKSCIYYSNSHYISLASLREWLMRKTWQRKETVFLLKILTWQSDTKTGLLEELKYYGEEREFLRFFRMWISESNFYTEKRSKMITESDIVVTDIGSIDDWTHWRTQQKVSLIVTDTIGIAESLRKRKTEKISLSKIITDIEYLSLEKSLEDDLILAFSLFTNIIEMVPERPTGIAKHVPWDHGETYFIKQRDIWHRGFWPLIWVAELLGRSREAVEKESDRMNRYKKTLWDTIERSIYTIISLISRENENLSIIISIDQENTLLSLVPRSIEIPLGEIFAIAPPSARKLLVYAKPSPILENFMMHEYGISMWKHEEKTGRNIHIIPKLDISWKKTVILTTSMKHIRTLHTELKGKFGIEHIFAQGISGGKAKMMTLFLRRPEKAILIGLIDTWQDEYPLWEWCDSIIIAKIPFDPPSDPYYLARTVGMKNNFEEYSMPIALSSVESLVTKILLAQENMNINLYDERLLSTTWGKIFSENLR